MTPKPENSLPCATPDHSHDSIYLVTHMGGGNEYPVYESCHHCSFIRVPEIDRLRAELKEKDEGIRSMAAKIDQLGDREARLMVQLNVAVEVLEKIKNQDYRGNPPSSSRWAKEALDKIKGNGK